MSKKIFMRALTAILIAATIAVFAGCTSTADDDKKPDDVAVTAGDVCTGLNITKQPNKVVYNYGEAFDPKGIAFDAVYRNGYTGDKNLGADDLDDWSPKGALTDSVSEVTLTYKDYQKTLAITVNAKTLGGLTITHEPNKTSYVTGNTLDLTGLVVKADYVGGTSDDNVTGYTVKDDSGKEYEQGTVLSSAANLTLTVSLTVGGVTKTASFTVKVENASGDECTDIVIKTNPKTAYKAGETFSPTGIVFDAVYRNGYTGDKNLGADDLDWSPKRALTAADTSVTLKYKTFEKSLGITVAEKVLTAVEITREPDTKTYSKGGALNLGGMIVKAVFDTGEQNITDYVVKDGDGNVYTNGTKLDTHGTVTLTVSYTFNGVTQSDTFDLTVYDGITVQAEAVLEAGAPTPTDASYTVMSGLGNIKTGVGSGDACVENVGMPKPDDEKGATKIEFYVYSEVDFAAADLSFTAASTNNNGTNKMGDLQFNKMFRVTVGDGETAEELFVGDGVAVKGKEIPSGMSRWFLWDEVTVGKIDISKGFTKITLECIGQILGADGSLRAANIDCMNIRTSASEDTREKAVKSVEITQNPKYTAYGANAAFTAEGLVVKAVYEDGTEAADAENYIIKDSEGNRIGQGDSVGAESRELALSVEITSGGATKSAPLNISVNSGTKITVEAEAFVAADATPPTDASYTAVTGKNKVETGNGATGVSDADIGTKIDFYVYSEKAVKGAVLNLTAASLQRGTGETFDSNFNTMFKVFVDGGQVAVGKDVVIAGRKAADGERIWFLWTDNVITNVDLNAGFTKITLECVGKIADGKDMRAANIDKIDITF